MKNEIIVTDSNTANHNDHENNRKIDTEPLSAALVRFHKEQLVDDDGPITIKEIVDFFADRGIAALLFVFGAPMCVPLPMLPGVALIFSLPLLFLSALMIGGVIRPWLPRAIADKKLSRKFVGKAINIALPWLLKIERYSRPRYNWMLSNLMYRVAGLVVGIFAISIMFPLPLSNTLPGIALVVMAIGVIMHDGLMILLGALFGLAFCFVLYYSAFVVGQFGLDFLSDTFAFLF